MNTLPSTECLKIIVQYGEFDKTEMVDMLKVS